MGGWYSSVHLSLVYGVNYPEYEVCIHKNIRCRTSPFIQSVPGGKVNILGGHSIGHSKQKVYMYVCLIPKDFRDRAISLYSSKIVDKKEILHTVCNTGINCSTDKVGTVYLVLYRDGGTCWE
jgi:hypothetical protein